MVGVVLRRHYHPLIVKEKEHASLLNFHEALEKHFCAVHAKVGFVGQLQLCET